MKDTDIVGYKVTGEDRNGKHISLDFPATTQGKIQTEGINLYEGSKWYVLRNGRKKLAYRVTN